MFTIPSVAVVATCTSKYDWSLIMLASRTQNGKRMMTPFISAREDCDLFASCPSADLWAKDGWLQLLRTRNLSPNQREALMENAVSDTIRQMLTEFRVLEQREVGFLSGVKNLQFGEAMENFHMSENPAFRWMAARESKVMDAVRLCRALAEKHKLHESTHEEKAAAHERALTNQKVRNRYV